MCSFAFLKAILWVGQIENVGDGKASIFLQPRGSKMYASLRLVEETMLVLARRNNCM